jgi:hypothetical protein
MQHDNLFFPLVTRHAMFFRVSAPESVQSIKILMIAANSAILSGSIRPATAAGKRINPPGSNVKGATLHEQTDDHLGDVQRQAGHYR